MTAVPYYFHLSPGLTVGLGIGVVVVVVGNVGLVGDRMFCFAHPDTTTIRRNKTTSFKNMSDKKIVSGLRKKKILQKAKVGKNEPVLLFSLHGQRKTSTAWVHQMRLLHRRSLYH